MEPRQLVSEMDGELSAAGAPPHDTAKNSKALSHGAVLWSKWCRCTSRSLAQTKTDQIPSSGQIEVLADHGPLSFLCRIFRSTATTLFEDLF